MVSREARRHAALDGEERALLRLFGSKRSSGESTISRDRCSFRRARNLSRSSNVSATSRSSGCSSASFFSAMQGPIETTAMSSPKCARSILQCASKGRQDRANMRQAFRMIFADEIHDRGTCGRNPDLLVRCASTKRCWPKPAARPERFPTRQRTQLLERTNQLRWPHSGILRHKRRSKRGNDRALAIDQGLGAGQVVAHLLGVAGAGQRAVAAQDAEFRHDLRAIILYANRLYRAFADAFIAILALVLPVLMKLSRSMLDPASGLAKLLEKLAQSLPP
jgi:hypothetical protein